MGAMLRTALVVLVAIGAHLAPADAQGAKCADVAEANGKMAAQGSLCHHATRGAISVEDRPPRR